MTDRDRDDKELQIAAVALWQRLGHRRQKEVAEKLRALYPQRGAFDPARVSNLCKFALASGFAIRPAPAEVVRGPATDEWLKALDEAERRLEEGASIKPVIERYCAEHGVRNVPTVTVVSGAIRKTDGQKTSEFATNAAKVALDFLRGWSEAYPARRLHLGVTWGRQLHLAAVAAMEVLSKGERPKGGMWVMPLVGLPIGGYRSEILSSSEIARSLTDSVVPFRTTEFERTQFDLQLVPAYLPENEFSEAELPALYKLLNLMEGWAKVFGPTHMTNPSASRAVTNAPAVFNCDFIWSSVSDLSQPFGFGTSRLPWLVPFADQANRQNTAGPKPVADCGGVPIWDESHRAHIEELEKSFERRWTGIRRHQWQHCVQQGFRALDRDKVICGAVLFAPTAEKAQSVLYALRDGLANVVILGRPCADKIMEILN